MPDNGGSLSVRQSAEWFQNAVRDKSIIVCRRQGKVVGYVLGTSLAAKAHVAIVQNMLRAFPPPPDCYLYGPACVAETERGNGVAGAMFDKLQAHMQGRPAMTFVRADNGELGLFVNDGIAFIALAYSDHRAMGVRIAMDDFGTGLLQRA